MPGTEVWKNAPPIDFKAPLDSLEIMEGVMRHFYQRALIEQRMGPQADWSVVDALMQWSSGQNCSLSNLSTTWPAQICVKLMGMAAAQILWGFDRPLSIRRRAVRFHSSCGKELADRRNNSVLWKFPGKRSNGGSYAHLHSRE